MYNRVLPEFQRFLLSGRIVPEKNVSFYAHWVNKFLSFAGQGAGGDAGLDARMFIDHLKNDPGITDWQLRQAETAIKLYADRFLKNVVPDENTCLPHDYTEIMDKLKEALRLKHYSYNTECSYLDWAKRFYAYMGKCNGGRAAVRAPGAEDVRNFLSHLALNAKVSASTQNQAFNALLFLFREILRIDLKGLGASVRAKRGRKMPHVLTVEEVKKMFQCLDGEHLLVAQLLYGAGLRLMELARLRVQDIDFGANTVFVRNAKGDNDRATMLPQAVRTEMHLHLERVRALHEDDLGRGYGEVYMPGALELKYPHAAKEFRWQYVFPSGSLSVDPRSGKVRRHHISESSIQNIVKNAVKKAGIEKHATVHTLRHSFATHLLMNGVNIREVQELLGHKHLETTMVYTHVLRTLSRAPESPLDSMENKGDE